MSFQHQLSAPTSSRPIPVSITLYSLLELAEDDHCLGCALPCLSAAPHLLGLQVLHQGKSHHYRHQLSLPVHEVDLCSCLLSGRHAAQAKLGQPVRSCEVRGKSDVR